MKTKKQIRKRLMECLDEIDAIDKHPEENDGTPDQCTERGKSVGRLEALLWVMGK